MSIKRQSAWNLAPQLVAAVTGFISLPLFLRFLGDENYAVWNYAIVFAALFGFADMGLGVSVGRYVGVALGQNDREAVRAYWGTGNIILLPFLLLMAATVAGLGMWLTPHWYNVAPHSVGVLRACVVATGCELFLGYYSQYWLILTAAYLDYKFIGLLRTATGLLRVIPALALAWLTKNPFLVAAWYAFAASVELVAFVWHGNKTYGLGLEWRVASFARAREMSTYLGKNFVGLIVGSVFGQIDRQILGRFAPHADYDHYTVAGNLAGRLQGLSVSVMGPVFYGTTRVVGGQRDVSAAGIYNETFRFVFRWYLLAAAWVAVWHPVLARFWLVHTMGMERGQIAAAHVGPLLVPLVFACCLSAVANISGAQLAPLNRIGTAVGFSAAAGLLAIAGVWTGWHLAGILGAAYGFLFSRIAFLAQDLYTIRLIKAQGWLDPKVWRFIVAQALVAAAFALAYLIFPADSSWLLLPALLHGGLVAAWISRRQLRKALASTGVFGTYS